MEIPALGHRLSYNPTTAATEENEGNTKYWECADCQKYFSDADGKTEISAKSSVIVPKLKKDNSSNVLLIILIVVLVIFVALITAGIILFILWKKRKNGGEPPTAVKG